jgi:hypothetical protein
VQRVQVAKQIHGIERRNPLFFQKSAVLFKGGEQALPVCVQRRCGTVFAVRTWQTRGHASSPATFSLHSGWRPNATLQEALLVAARPRPDPQSSRRRSESIKLLFWRLAYFLLAVPQSVACNLSGSTESFVG